MIVCLCNPFSDKKVKALLDDRKTPCRVAEVYSACSDGKRPQCCSCLETLKDMVKTHKKTIAI